MGPMHDLLDVFDEIDLSTLARTEELGALNFEPAVEQLSMIRRIFEAANALQPIDLPSTTLADVPVWARHIKDVVESIKSFGVNVDRPGDSRNGILGRVNEVRNWALLSIRPHLNAETVNYREAAMEIDRTLERSLATYHDVQRLASQVQLAASGVGAAELSFHYRAQAEGHGTAAKWYLVGAATIGAGTVVAAAIMFAKLTVDLDAKTTSSTQWAELVRDIVIRVFFLGLFSYALSFCVRNYRVNSHLRVVNEQKKNALDTFGLFAEAAPTDEARSLITAELVRAVFAASDSGYLDQGPEKSIIEHQSGALGVLLNKKI